MRDIYHETIDRAFLALSHSENMLEILRLWLETLGDKLTRQTKIPNCHGINNAS